MKRSHSIAGVLGHPISHSLSPDLHGFWLSSLGLNGHYIPIDVHPDDLSSVLKTLPKMGVVGVNVTIPHKENVFALATEVSPTAARVQAANTLTFLDDGGFYADNTDGFGFIQNIKANAPTWSPSDGPVAIIGAGGATRAILVALLDEGAEEIRISNRTQARAERLLEDLEIEAKIIPWGQSDPLLRGAKTVINTTSLGMKGQPDFSIDLSPMEIDALATDIVYSPLDTPFLKLARNRGAQTVDGLGMLLWQGVPGFSAWFDQTPEVSNELRVHLLGLLS